MFQEKLYFVLEYLNCAIVRGHHEGGPTAHSKNFKTPFFKRFWKILSRDYFKRSRTSPIFSFWISQQIRLLEASTVSAEMGCGWQADWATAEIFFSNLCTHEMNKCWKFQADILIHVWFRAKRLKICCNNRPPLGNWCWCLPRGGLLLQQIFSLLAFGLCSINLPATACFGQNFGCL